MKTKSISKLKENITAVEYKKLMNGVRGNETIRANTKSNMLRTFCILYFTGLRLNELQDLRVSNIRELIENGTTKAILSKTSSERRLFLTDEFKKELTKLLTLMVFNVAIENKDDHAKNFSFLYNNGNWILSPAYDLLKSDGFGGEHATSILGVGNPTRKDMLELADEIKYPHKKMMKIIDKVFDNCNNSTSMR